MADCNSGSLPNPFICSAGAVSDKKSFTKIKKPVGTSEEILTG